jgi:hypothetical protein
MDVWISGGGRGARKNSYLLPDDQMTPDAAIAQRLNSY